jgi:L-rhamnose mutarotase
MAQRACFILSIRPDAVDEYRARHAEVWPEMREALSDSGWRNYSLFLTDEGTLVGYVECDDFDAVRQRMSIREVNDRWQAEMRRFFSGIDGDPDQSMTPIPEIFHLP